MKKDKSVKIGLKSLVLMIFSAIFGFSNSLTAYYQMGYASIVWYIITAILFFLPSALIFAEYGAAFKGVKGGIFSKEEIEGACRHKYTPRPIASVKPSPKGATICLKVILCFPIETAFPLIKGSKK